MIARSEPRLETAGVSLQRMDRLAAEKKKPMPGNPGIGFLQRCAANGAAPLFCSGGHCCNANLP
jgi:hypothetical protein